MRQKKCKRCGVVFATAKKGTYMCPSCALEIKRETVRRTRVCTLCGAEYEGFPASKYCPDCGREVRREADRKRQKTGPARKLGSTDLCVECGKPYIVTNGRQRYCKDCAAIEVPNNVRAHKREYSRSYMTPKRIEYKKSMTSYNKVCVICGNVFNSGLPNITCSPECARELNRRQQRKDYEKRRKKTAPSE